MKGLGKGRLRPPAASHLQTPTRQAGHGAGDVGCACVLPWSLGGVLMRLTAGDVPFPLLAAGPTGSMPGGAGWEGGLRRSWRSPEQGHWNRRGLGRWASRSSLHPEAPQTRGFSPAPSSCPQPPRGLCVTEGRTWLVGQPRP